jgi:predicted Zn-dependent protease
VRGHDGVEAIGEGEHERAVVNYAKFNERVTEKARAAILLDYLLGNNQSLITDIAATLASLKFSRNNELEADDYSVVYLCPTEWKADGAAAFFEKLIAQGTSNPPEFLSTHPNPGNRVENIKAKKTTLGCTGAGTFDQRYQDFKNSLP